MKILNVSERKHEEIAGWTAKVEGGKVTSFVTNSNGLFTKELFVATTKKASEVNPTKITDNVEILPLYGKALIDVKKEKSSSSTALIYFETEEGVEIRDIKLFGCASIVHRINNERTACALTLFNLRQNTKILIILSNGEVRIIENAETVTKDKCKGAVPEAKQIVVKRLIFLPKKTYFTRYAKDGENKGPVSFKDGFISVSIAQALSKYSEVIGNPSEIEYDPNLTEKDLEDLKKMLTNNKIIHGNCEEKCENCTCEDNENYIRDIDWSTPKIRNRDKKNNVKPRKQPRKTYDENNGKGNRKPFNKKNNKFRK